MGKGENLISKFCFFVVLSISLCFWMTSTALAQNYTVNISSYSSFRSQVLGQAYDIDNMYGCQCWDGAALLWQQLGRHLLTGNGYAAGTWDNAQTNAGDNFSLITGIQNVKRGDVVVFGYDSIYFPYIADGGIIAGHIAFADENYNGSGYLNILGQNQTVNHAVHPEFTVAKVGASAFRGAFRLKTWTSIDNGYTGSEMSTGYDRTLPDGDYLIANAADTSLYVDIAGSDVPAAAGTNVSLYLMTKAEASPSEIFTIKYQNGFYSIMQKGTNRCLTVSGGSKSPGANVLIDTSNGSSAQKWAISDNNRNGFRLQAKCSGFSLDVAGAAITKGTNIQQNGNNDFDCQAWVFIPYKPAQPIENGRYILLSGLDNTMEVVVSTERNIHLWKADDTDSKNNAFDVVKLNNGYYKLTNTLFKMCLDVEHAVTNYEKNIQVWTDKGSDNQQWAIIKCGDGYALISR